MVWAANDFNIALDNDEPEDDIISASINYCVGRFFVVAEVWVANSPNGARLAAEVAGAAGGNRTRDIQLGKLTFYL